MDEKIQFIGFTREEAKHFIRDIVLDCLTEMAPAEFGHAEVPLTIRDACRIIGVSPPTLKKFVDQSLIRRHDLGGRKKIFYRSELEEDIKRIELLKVNRSEILNS